MGVRAASLGAAALVVPALADRLGAGIGDEMVIDVIHPRDHRVRGQHRRRERGLQRNRVGAVSDRGQLRPQGPQPRQRPEPRQRPRVGGGQVLELLDRRLAEREAHLTAVSGAVSRRERPALSTVPASARARNACSSIAPAYRDSITPSLISGPGHASGVSSRPCPGTSLSGTASSGSCSAACPVPARGAPLHPRPDLRPRDLRRSR